MNGMDFIRAIRQLKYDVPILVLSSSDDFSSIMEGIRLGALDYITKDSRAAERVVHAVAKALRYSKMVETNSELNDSLKERNRELELDRHNRRLLERFMLLNEELTGKMDQADLELSRRLAQITALNEVTHAIGSVLELDQVLQMTMQKSCEVMNAEASTLFLAMRVVKTS